MAGAQGQSASRRAGWSTSAGLVRDTPSAANVRAYADAVRERSTLRRLITVGGEIAASAFDPEGRAAAELVDEAERRVFEIAEAGNKAGSGFIPLKEELGAVDRPTGPAAPVERCADRLSAPASTSSTR